jgi:hypothetical protein
VNDGIVSALEQARLSAGERDIRISGGANVIQQYLDAGVVDELEISLAPVMFGGGRRLFENIGEVVPAFKIDRVVDTPPPSATCGQIPVASISACDSHRSLNGQNAIPFARVSAVLLWVSVGLGIPC